MLNKDQQNLFYKKLGENIKAARINSKERQESLAQHLGLNRVSIVNIEKGKQKVQLHSLLEIASFLKTTVGDLIPSLDVIKSSHIDPKLSKSMDKELEQVDDKDQSRLRVSEFVMYSTMTTRSK